LRYEDFEDFIRCYNADNIYNRKETERFRVFTYDEIIKRDKVNLDIFWLKDESIEDTENLPEPEVLAEDICENLESALDQFSSIYEELKVKQSK
jgi:type I restriction enzyme M protein